MKRAALLICLLVAPAASLASGVEFEARVWSPDLTGAIQVTSAVAGTRIDPVSDLGIGEDEFPGGRFIWRPSRRTSLRMAYTQLDFAGSQVLTRTITFAGSTFEISSPVTSSLDLEYAQLGFAWQFLASRDGRFRLGPLAEVKGFRGDASIAATGLTTAPLRAAEEFEVAFGAGGVALDIEARSGRLHLYAEWTELIGSDDGDLTDTEIGLRFYPLDFFAVTLGYRTVEIRADDSDDSLDIDIDGPFFGGVLRF